MKKSQSIFKVAFAVTILVTVGKALGFVREMVLAGFYGSTPETDAYFLAQSMPGMLFPSVCNSLSTAFISIYSRKKTKMLILEERKYVYGVLFIIASASSVLSIVGILLSPVAVTIFAPGFSPFQHKLAVKLTMIVMSSFMIIMLQYMLIAVANANEEFVKVHIASLVYNVVIIIMLVVNGKSKNIYFLTYSVILGQVTMVFILCGIVIRRVPLTIKTCVKQRKKDVIEVVQMAIPILISSAGYQINAIVDKVLSSFLQEGTVSALSYSYTLISVVVSIFVTAISTVIYPHLSQLYVQGSIMEFKERINDALIILETILIPISVIVLFLAKEVVQIIYGHGSFDSDAVILTSRALFGYAFVFVGTGVVEIMTRAFYAKGDSKKPIKATVTGIIINILASAIAFKPLGIMGITLGTTVGTIVSATIIYFDYHRMFGGDKYVSVYRVVNMLIPIVPETLSLVFLNRYLVMNNHVEKVIIFSLAGFIIYVLSELIVSADLRRCISRIRER